MFKSYYKICVEGQNIKRFIKMLYKYKISLNYLKSFDKKFYAIINEQDFKKLMNIKTSYKIKVIKVYGFELLKKEMIKNIYFILSNIIGIIIILLLSNITFKIEIIHDDTKLKEKLSKELIKYGIKKYSIIKNYDDIQKIKEKILINNKKDIEWLEIERVGVKYVVRLEKRIINTPKEETGYRHIVAKKEGIIKKIDAEKGEISKKENDYVSKGDILISGAIHKNDDILDNTLAKGKVFAEVWYKVKVTLPINYYEKKYTGNNKNIINISFLDSNINIFDYNEYKEKEVKQNVLFSDFFDMFKISLNQEKELNIIDNVYLMINDDAAINLARKKIEEKLSDEEYIISQKKLKTSLNNSTMNVEIFFKVYENIVEYKYYKIGDVIE